MLLSGAVDRFCHFRFKNQSVVEVGGAFWVMGHSRAYSGGIVNTLEQNSLAAVNQGITQQIAVNACNLQVT